MTGFRIGAMLFLLSLLQTSLLPLLSLPLARPDLLLILTVFVALASKPEKAIITGFIAGLGQDAFSMALSGVSSFAKSLLGYFGANVRHSFIVSNLSVQLVVVGLGTLLNGFVVYWMGKAFGSRATEVGALFHFSGVVLPELVSNLIFACLLLPMLRRILPFEEQDTY